MKHLKHAEFESCKNDQSEQSICQIDQSQVLEVVNPKWSDTDLRMEMVMDKWTYVV